ncbi:MAG: hypothetical protein ACYSUI_18210 [Planctomycetota bacterium]
MAFGNLAHVRDRGGLPRVREESAHSLPLPHQPTVGDPFAKPMAKELDIDASQCWYLEVEAI